MIFYVNILCVLLGLRYGPWSKAFQKYPFPSIVIIKVFPSYHSHTHTHTLSLSLSLSHWIDGQQILADNISDHKSWNLSGLNTILDYFRKVNILEAKKITLGKISLSRPHVTWYCVLKCNTLTMSHLDGYPILSQFSINTQTRYMSDLTKFFKLFHMGIRWHI